MYHHGAKRLMMILFAMQISLAVFSQDDYLGFLYKYMPLPDSTDYSREFWQMNVDYALKARKEMSWNVPEREWKHFVLPPRVNNENLDSARAVLYPILKKRVEGLSMYDAILEVNHWCHENVTYKPSDARTSSPLSTLRNAVGRCGEESTFTVSALRTIGIPARQVYTPRWAHTDDNHAWVEAWADGKWYFLGACEPEPVLNLGWFNAPASRGMLMHTNVFGEYDGPENIISHNACFTEIDVTDHYAPVETFSVKVVDRNGRPVSANVEFKLYNYGEYYTVARKKTDAKGMTTFSAGLGDLLMWASDGENFGFVKHSPGQKTIKVKMDKNADFEGSFDLNITPPRERNTVPALTDEQVSKNKRRLAYEDSLRQTKDTSNPDLKRFLSEAQDKQLANRLVAVIVEKDCKDITYDVLMDHYLYADQSLINKENAQMDRYLLNPRVSNEMLRPWRHELSVELRKLFVSAPTPDEWKDWVNKNIVVDDKKNPKHYCMSPLSVFRHRVTDSHSRDIFMVAGARALGIPARINEITGKVEVPLRSDDESIDVPSQPVDDVRPTLTLTCDEEASYYSHFSLSKLENGRLHLQEFPEEGCTVKSTFAPGVKMDRGTYLLNSGTRLANGGVLAHMEFFKLDSDRTIPLTIRHDNAQIQVIGNFNAEDIYTADDGTQKSVISTVGRGYYVLGLVRDHHEPTNHALNDIRKVQDELDKVGRPMLIINGEKNQQIVDEIRASLHMESKELPIFIIADSFNRIVWVKQGYTIGLGEQILGILKRL